MKSIIIISLLMNYTIFGSSYNYILGESQYKDNIIVELKVSNVFYFFNNAINIRFIIKFL
jgi:hypothetical protein